MEEEGKPMEEIPTTLIFIYYTCNHQGHLVVNCPIWQRFKKCCKRKHMYDPKKNLIRKKRRLKMLSST